MMTYITGIGMIAALMVLWVVVQNGWRKTFADQVSDEDVLANRSSCSHCQCSTSCQKDGSNSTMKQNTLIT